MTEIPIFSVVAYSGTGKTTLLEKLIPELKRLGMRIAVVKHDAHDFEIDHEGKDSWRMTRAGADVTAIVSAEKTAIMENRPVAFETILERISGVDIILTEGYKHGALPKIAVYRGASGTPLAVSPEECFAVMSDTPLETSGPAFELDDAKSLAEYIVKVVKQKKTK